jgi:hypothetical protein
MSSQKQSFYRQVFDSIPMQFIIGGTLVTVITYFANTLDNPKLAAIVTAFPIGLIPILFMWSNRNAKSYTLDATYTNFIVVLTYLFFDYLIRNYPNFTLLETTLLSFGAWLVICLFAYIIVLV